MEDADEKALVFATSSLVRAVSPSVEAGLVAAFTSLWRRLDSEESRRAYRGDWKRWCLWLAANAIDPLEATTTHVESYLVSLRDLGRKKTTASRALTVLRKVYAALCRAGLLAVNPAREVEPYRTSDELRTPWLSEEEIRKLLTRPTDARDQRDWLIVATIVGTGLRRTEVANLSCDQIFDASPTQLAARVTTKGNKEGVVFFPAWLSIELRAWLTPGGKKRTGPLFELNASSGVAAAVKRVARRAGVNLQRTTPHALRRSFATLTGQRGVSIEDRQLAMFHRSKTTTERYDKNTRMMQQVPGDVLADLVAPKDEP